MGLEEFTSKLKREGKEKKEISVRKVNLYDVVNSVFDKRSVGSHSVLPYILLRAISMDESLLSTCAALSKYSQLGRELFMMILLAVLPRRNRGFGFFKYIKPVKFVDETLLGLVAKHFHVSKRDAKRVIVILKHEGIPIDGIKMFFGIE